MRLTLVDNWNLIGPELERQGSPLISRWFLTIVVFVGNRIVTNVLVGLMIESVSSANDDYMKEQREKKDLEANKKTSVISASSKIQLDKMQINKVPKASEKPVISNSTYKNASKVETTISKQVTDKSDDKHSIEKSNLNKNSFKNELLEERKKLEAERKQLEEMRRAIEEEKRKLAQSKNKLEDTKSQPTKLNLIKPKTVNKQISKDIKPQQKKFPPPDLKLQSSLANKPKQPLDVRLLKSKPIIKKASNKSKITYNYGRMF